MKTSDFKDLDVWNKSMDLTVGIYSMTNLLPSYERFGLADQIRRCAVSIPSNISEGHGRNAIKEFIRFLNISCGSANELETQLILCSRLGYVDLGSISPLLKEIKDIRKMIHALIRYLESKL